MPAGVSWYCPTPGTVAAPGYWPAWAFQPRATTSFGLAWALGKSGGTGRYGVSRLQINDTTGSRGRHARPPPHDGIPAGHLRGLGMTAGEWVKVSARAEIKVAVQLVEGPLLIGWTETAYGS